MTSNYVKRCSWNCTWKPKWDSTYTQENGQNFKKWPTQGCKATTPINMGGRYKMFNCHLHVHLQPQDVTLFGISIFAGVFKLKWGHSGWALNPMTYILLRRGNLTYRDTGDIREEATWGWRQRLGHKPRIASSQQKLREASKIRLFPGAFGGSLARTTSWYHTPWPQQFSMPEPEENTFVLFWSTQL